MRANLDREATLLLYQCMRFFILLTLLISATSLNAQYLRNYLAWKQLSADTHLVYVLGVMEGYLYTNEFSTQYQKDFAEVIGECLNEGLGPEDLLAMVNERYMDQANWDKSASHVTIGALVGACILDR